MAQSGENSCAVVLSFRGGKLVDKSEYIMRDFGTDPASVTEFLQSFYADKTDIPKEIALHEDCEDAQLISRWLSEKANHRVTISVPQKGERRKTTEMAYNNAAERLSHEKLRTSREVAVLDELARLLGLEKPPERIEA